MDNQGRFHEVDHGGLSEEIPLASDGGRGDESPSLPDHPVNPAAKKPLGVVLGLIGLFVIVAGVCLALLGDNREESDQDKNKVAIEEKNLAAKASQLAERERKLSVQETDVVERKQALEKEQERLTVKNEGIKEKENILKWHNEGLDYYKGRNGVQNNKKLAELSFLKAAEQGHIESQNYLGYMYSHGAGVPQSQQKAVRWYQEAARQGYDSAQWNLGQKYLKGEGVFKDKQKAREWIAKAAAQGHKKATDYVIEND